MTAPTISGLPAPITIRRVSDDIVRFEFGKIGSPPQPDLGAYTVNIDGTDFHIPQHGWFQSWVWRRNPLMLKRTPKEIIAANRAFPYGDTGRKMTAMTPVPPFTGPMDNAGVGKYMPTGGGGSDRGLVTDPSAHFLRTGDATAMLTQALVSDGFPINYVDDTGKPIDLLKYPAANIYGTEHQPFFPRGPKNKDGAYAFAGGWEMDIPHFPSLAYIAFQATQDVGLLYNLQHAANLPSLQDVYASANMETVLKPYPDGFPKSQRKAVISAGQTRQIAWGLRNIFEAHIATLDAETLGILPADLHPSSYFKALLDNNLAFYSPVMNDPNEQTFRLIGPNLGHIGMWQCDYLHSTLAFAVLTGHSDWTPLFLWALGNVIARSNGTSGWPPALCTTYKFSTVPGGENPKLPRFTWAQALQNLTQPDVESPFSQAEIDAFVAHPMTLQYRQTGAGLEPLLGHDYAQGISAVLTQADYLETKGLAAVGAKYPDFGTCKSNVSKLMTQGNIPMQERFSVVVDTSKVPENPPGENSPPDGGQHSPPETPPDTGQDSPPAQPPNGGTMIEITQGVEYRLTPKIRVPAGAIHFGVKPGTWKNESPDQATLTPEGDAQSTAIIKATVDTTAEQITVKVDVFVDQAKTKTITLTETLSDLLVVAQSGGFDVAPVKTAGGTV